MIAHKLILGSFSTVEMHQEMNFQKLFWSFFILVPIFFKMCLPIGTFLLLKKRNDKY